HQLVLDSGVLDVNSAYLYFLLADHFGETCVVAENEGELLGFLTAYRLPRDPSVLFVWQIGVSDRARGQGVASGMLEALRTRRFFGEIREIQLTISPSNQASQGLFRKWADKLGTRVETRDYLTEEHLGDQHEPELLYTMHLKS
ncbi:MAG: diaminobutyrate acetyltransferase, partial [Halothiobacillaceae bacterium]